MSIADLKFDTSDFKGKDIISLDNRQKKSAQELKARFDNIGKMMLALGNFNDLLDVLQAPSGAGEIGAAAYDDIAAATVQEFLQGIANRRVVFKTDNARYLRLNDDLVMETSADGKNWQATGSGGHIILD